MEWEQNRGKRFDQKCIFCSSCILVTYPQEFSFLVASFPNAKLDHKLIISTSVG